MALGAAGGSRVGLADVNGVKLHYEVAGSGAPLVLAHSGLVMPGVAHVANMERPEEFNRLVLDFLNSVT